jgi:hypothetical protein
MRSMTEEAPLPHHRHPSVASLASPEPSPKPSLDTDHDLQVQTHDSPRTRFSLDLHDPLNPTLYPHTHPVPPVQPLYRRLLKILSLILLWYTFSLLLSLYNKWMFAPDHWNFPFPLFVTGLHMLVQFCLSGLVLWWFPQFRPKREEYLSLKDYTYPPSTPLSLPNLCSKS